jgi:hypothetical protein
LNKYRVGQVECFAEHRDEGPFTTTFYNDNLDADDVATGLPSRRPVWALAPESVIVAPAPDTVVAVGEPVEIWGWACSFHGISAAEISVDRGATYLRAALEPRRGWAWQRFSLPWRPIDRGETFVSARAFRPMALVSRSMARAIPFTPCGSSCSDQAQPGP